MVFEEVASVLEVADRYGPTFAEDSSAGVPVWFAAVPAEGAATPGGVVADVFVFGGVLGFWLALFVELGSVGELLFELELVEVLLLLLVPDPLLVEVP